MKKLTIWEYTCCVTALIILMFVMALVSGEKLMMKDGLRIVYSSLLPFVLLRTFNKKGKLILFLIVYIIFLIYIYQ